jgi:hypothetical protein
MSHRGWSQLTASQLHQVQLGQRCGAQGSPRRAEPRTVTHPTSSGSASLPYSVTVSLLLFKHCGRPIPKVLDASFSSILSTCPFSLLKGFRRLLWEHLLFRAKLEFS